MIKVENLQVWGFEHAIRGMRNPLDSWERSDSYTDEPDIYGNRVVVGDADMELMRRLYKAGTEHRKFLRQIAVSMDITAPLYWWKETDTYKIGTVSNSCSTMHTIHKEEFTLDDFSHEHLMHYADGFDDPMCALRIVICLLNDSRKAYLERGEKVDWWQIIQLLPSSYNQRRTVTMNYENVVNIIHQRAGHKLDEWNDFVSELKKLPYVEKIMEGE